MYTVKKTGEPLPVNGDTGHKAWNRAEELSINCYPWYKNGEKQKTRARTLYSDTALYLLFTCEDRHISALVTELNGDVCNDSCVEFFASPEPAVKPHYFNIEINCGGVILVGYGPDRFKRIRISQALASGINIWHSVPEVPKTESEGDRGWIIQAEVPFSVLNKLAGIPAPVPGTVWKANYYRCGGITDPQYAVWSDITVAKPDFHQPGCFGAIQFE